MTASVIISHPYEKSFNHAIFDTVTSTFRALGVRVYPHDLYKENFDPVLSKRELGKEETEDIQVKQYIKEMMESKILVFVHPNWWGQPPAMMKGYIDRVFRPPYAYDYDEKKEGEPGIGKLTGKVGIVFNTGNTDERRENEYFHDPLENEWKQCLFGFCGIEKYERRLFRIIADSTKEQRGEWLKEVEMVIRNSIED
jgi:NAD(P)H dehydrogenase (quinone)